MTQTETAEEFNLNHMAVEGNEWEQWRARTWNTLADRFGYPGMMAVEQWYRRSQKEKRCAVCGLPGTVRQKSVLVKAVSHYWMCEGCDDYFRRKHG